MNTEAFERKLTAILSADVKGYSRVMRADEDETIRTITAYRTAIAKLVEQYRGRVVDSPAAQLDCMVGDAQGPFCISLTGSEEYGIFYIKG